MKPEKYRFDPAYGKLYEWFTEDDCYVFIMHTQAKTKAEAVKEYEEWGGSDR